MKIEKAKYSDASQLTALTLESMNYWNYGAAQIEAWRDKLTIDVAHIESHEVFTLHDNDRILGYYSYHKENSSLAKLDYLFIRPDYIGKGIGTRLMQHFMKQLQLNAIKKATLDSDPNAEKFYHHFGFVTKGKLATSIENRFLAVMEKEL